jgi:hypothetical protein
MVWRGLAARWLGCGLVAPCDGRLLLSRSLARTTDQGAQATASANGRNIFANIIQHPGELVTSAIG